MLLLVFAIDKDVIHERNYTGEAFKDLVHVSLKVLLSTRYAKWHLVEAKGVMKVVSKGDFPGSTVGI